MNWSRGENGAGPAFKEGTVADGDDITVIVTDNISGDRATYDKNTRVFEISKDYLTQFDWAYKIAASMHEFGHALGFLGADCSGASIMSGMTSSSYVHYFTECDQNKMNQIYGNPIRRDDDGDGWSPDEGDDYWEPDWCDSDPDSNPGYQPTCDIGSGEDRNCDGVDDLYQCDSPILIDVAGNGVRLTDAVGGVTFDLEGDGFAQQLSWIAEGSDDAWLALDRNGNGAIDDGTELFGNFTPQPASATPNGFLALAALDDNQDRWIDAADAVFERLRLWNDANHDARTQPGELRGLSAAGIRRLSLDYTETMRRDRYGNLFRLKAKIDAAGPDGVGKFAWDVFLVGLPRSGAQASEAPRRERR